MAHIVPLQVDRVWGTWGSCYNKPKAIFYLLKGDYRDLKIVGIFCCYRSHHKVFSRNPKHPEPCVPAAAAECGNHSTHHPCFIGTSRVSLGLPVT